MAPSKGIDQPRRLEPGPRKKRSSARVRRSNHKRRSVWFQSRVTWPVREAPIDALVRERAKAARALPKAAAKSKWESVGPANIGGRCTSIVCDPQNPDHIWVGAAGGGVWSSKDGGRSWRALWHRQRVLNVGSLALDPHNSSVLYAGTGEANLSADSYPGVGIYRSTNGGASWRLLASCARTGVPQRIGVIAIDPFDPAHIVIGGVGYSEDEKGGLYASQDGGRTWQRNDFISAHNYWCHAVVFHPTKIGTLYATVTENGARNGIWRSRNGGVSWTQLVTGLPGPGAMARTSLALSPSNPDVLYALAATDTDLVLGVFRSTNGGDSWKNVAGSHFENADEGQLLYGNTIVVHPTNPNHVLCGGVDLHRTVDGGKNWRRVTAWDAQRGEPDYAHADHHALVMPATRPGLVLDANDGGLDVSEDGGRTWSNRSVGLAATMFYDVDVAQTKPGMWGGGAQDNGTVLTETGKADDFNEILGGDGGWIVIDPAQDRHVYASFQNMEIYRWRSNGTRSRVTPPAPKYERESIWMTYITFDPGNARTVFCGSSRVWRTKTDGDLWVAVSPELDGSPITAIEVAAADTGRVYVGTENGGFFRSLDGGQSWSPNLAGATLPGYTITRIESDPRNARTLFVTIANFGHSHLFRSNDGGTNWVDADNGRLPDVPHSAVLIRPDAPDTVYVSNDAGVFVSQDLGVTWRSLRGNLPNVMVVDLVYRQADASLYAATYGRSIWRLRV